MRASLCRPTPCRSSSRRTQSPEHLPSRVDAILHVLTRACIFRYVHQYDEELSNLKKARRPGRPASAREDLLKVKITTLEKEHQNGFRE